MNPSEYLTEKVGKVILDSDRLYNSGAVLIANVPNWESLITSIVEVSWDTCMEYCSTQKVATYKAAAKLTFVSTTIGNKVALLLELTEPSIKDLLTLGDLLIETFLQAGLVDIYREYRDRKSPYLLQIKHDTDLVRPVLLGTFTERPDDIKCRVSPLTKESFIKGWTDDKEFTKHLDSRFIKALNILRQQPWQVNKTVLDTALMNPPKRTFNLIDLDTGEIHECDIYGKLPSGNFLLNGVPFLGKSDPHLQKLISKYYEYTQVIKKASTLRDKTFYQEVSCDYRGRVYYSESFFSYQGGDLARSMFLFENKKEVTTSGYRWLCIKAACFYNQSYDIDKIPAWCSTDYKKYLQEEGLDTISVDKMTLQDRETWSLENILLISSTAFHEAVDDKAEKPYSFLAACLEIEGYLSAQCKGVKYFSGYPVAVDGHCNGWQHLAAMSKDALAGDLVSLTKSPIQKDFYVSVAKELVVQMPQWFEERDIPMKHIRKGIAKRGSMTRAYSAGKKRIAANMYDDCYMSGYTNKYKIDEEQCTLLAGHLIDAINKVCAGPLKTTKYLQKIVEHELATDRNIIEWITPSGFPVKYKANLQHEHKQRGTIKGIKGNKDGRVMHVVKIDFRSKTTGEKVACRRSFASGISPNVVHSYDAAHMANTIVSFGGSFAAVHDSFSTHADDVDFLLDVAKMTFIAQYDVENFFSILQDNIMLNKDTFKVEPPSLGKLDIKAVADSDYFFS